MTDDREQMVKLDAGLDGFTIERGYAYITGAGITGGNYEACTISNCVIRDNSAPSDVTRLTSIVPMAVTAEL